MEITAGSISLTEKRLGFLVGLMRLHLIRIRVS